MTVEIASTIAETIASALMERGFHIIREVNRKRKLEQVIDEAILHSSMQSSAIVQTAFSSEILLEGLIANIVLKQKTRDDSIREFLGGPCDDAASYGLVLDFCDQIDRLFSDAPDSYASVKTLRGIEEIKASLRLPRAECSAGDSGNDGVSFSAKPRNTPPFIFVYSDVIPEQMFSVKSAQLSFKGVVWADRAAYSLTIFNNSIGEILLTDLFIEQSTLSVEPRRGVEFIEQGTRNALEFVFELDSDRSRPSLVKTENGVSYISKRCFFEDGNYIAIPPGGQELLLVSFCAPLHPVVVSLNVELMIDGAPKVVKPTGLSEIRIVPSNSIPEDGRFWRIHLDGRTSGKGFPQDATCRPRLR